MPVRRDRRVVAPREAGADRAVDAAFAHNFVARLAAIGTGDLGFRVAGTPEDDEACALVAAEMAAIGLQQIAREPVPVDAWRFTGASLSIAEEVLRCSCFGGVAGTLPSGVEGGLVFVGEGRREELRGLDLRGRIALFDWRGDQLYWPALTAADLGHAGAVAAVCTCLPGARYYQAERSLGSFDSMGFAGSPPLAYLPADDAARVIARLRQGVPLQARLVVDAELTRGATAHNVVGSLPGCSQGAPIVIGGHHDAWFSGAFDDASGVAATLAIAKALADSGYEPEHTIVFTSHTAEEYGRADAQFDWLIGAWWQIAHEHPQWAREAVLYLNVEGTGMAGAPTVVDSPPELRHFARRVLGRARRDGLLRHGNVWDVPRTGTEQWPWAAAGVPSLGVADVVPHYMQSIYHTQYDTLEIVDRDRLADGIRLYTRLVMAADRDPAGLLDLAARPRQVRRRGGLASLDACGVGTRRLRAALDRHEAAALRSFAYETARAAFHATATAVEGLNARDKQDLAYVQAANDLAALAEGGRSLARGRHGRAVAALERVGRNALTARLSEPVFARDAARHRSDHPGIAWAGPYETPSANLWAELAALRGEPGARAAGAWIAASVEAARERAADEAQMRVDAVAAGFERAADILEADDGT
ncbi:MAG TPA: M20/M25/M40 family metallo-hydrolase [Gaiellales bacterium]|nr:M20/M25/M40 family metallo-hydrolase [Gaiellales bacterium]